MCWCLAARWLLSRRSLVCGCGEGKRQERVFTAADATRIASVPPVARGWTWPRKPEKKSSPDTSVKSGTTDPSCEVQGTDGEPRRHRRGVQQMAGRGQAGQPSRGRLRERRRREQGIDGVQRLLTRMGREKRTHHEGREDRRARRRSLGPLGGRLRDTGDISLASRQPRDRGARSLPRTLPGRRRCGHASMGRRDRRGSTGSSIGSQPRFSRACSRPVSTRTSRASIPELCQRWTAERRNRESQHSTS